VRAAAIALLFIWTSVAKLALAERAMTTPILA